MLDLTVKKKEDWFEICLRLIIKVNRYAHSTSRFTSECYTVLLLLNDDCLFCFWVHRTSMLCDYCGLCNSLLPLLTNGVSLFTVVVDLQQLLLYMMVMFYKRYSAASNRKNKLNIINVDVWHLCYGFLCYFNGVAWIAIFIRYL